MPTRDTPWPSGTPCWIDYGAEDLDAAKAFYAALSGWEYSEGQEEYGGYLNALKNGQQAAGLGPRMDPNAPVAWTTYFATDDSTAAVGRITEAGGTVLVQPMEVGPFGIMTIAVDPQGNMFGLWGSREHTGVQIYNEPDAFAWTELMVADTAAARQFYSAVFGWTFQELGPEAGDTGDMDYKTFSLGENPLGGSRRRAGRHAHGLADLLRRGVHRRRSGHRRVEGRQGDDACDGHPVRAVRGHRGPVGRSVRGDGPANG